jgi:hypothetical protein
MKTEIYCEIYTRKGVIEARIVSVKRELPTEMTEEEAARWIYQSAGERLPKVKDKHIHHD